MSRRADCRKSHVVGSLAWVVCAILAASLALGAETGTTPQTGLDRAALDAELSRPLVEVQRRGSEALRSHAQRLVEFHAALDVAQDVSPDERRALADRILGRVARVGLFVRDGGGNPSRNLPGRRGTAATVLSGAFGAVLEFLGESFLLLVGLLGGVVVAYALGRLSGYRRGASDASYYGAGDPRRGFVVRAGEAAKPGTRASRIGVEQIRQSLAEGRPVLLQLGYDVAPRRREEYLAAIREWQRVLKVGSGSVLSVWEDPRGPNRFYEVVGCDRLEVLELLTSDRGEPGGLNARIEACWLPGRPVLRRAWWGAFPDRVSDASRRLAVGSSGYSREDRAA